MQISVKGLWDCKSTMVQVMTWYQAGAKPIYVDQVLMHTAVWYKTKFGSQNLATNFGNHL